MRWRGEEDVNWRRGARDVTWRGEVTRVRGEEELNLPREMSWSRERGVTTDRRSELEKKDERFPGRLHSGVPGGQDLVYSFLIVWSFRSDADHLKVILSGGHESGRHHQAEQAQGRQGRGRNGGLMDLALWAPSDLSTGFPVWGMRNFLFRCATAATVLAILPESAPTRMRWIFYNVTYTFICVEQLKF